MEAIVLAGGLGTRLASRLNQTPKPMAQIGGRPFLEILLDQLIAAGCSRIILSVGHLGDVILQRFQNRYRDVPIDYAIEESPLGTGGAIRLALGQAREPSVLVVNGDTYLEADLSALARFHRSSWRPLTMAVVRVDDTARYGGVLIEDDVISGFLKRVAPVQVGLTAASMPSRRVLSGTQICRRASRSKQMSSFRSFSRSARQRFAAMGISLILVPRRTSTARK